MSLKMKEPTKENIINSEKAALAPLIWTRNPELGASTVNYVGVMGSGKTNAMVRTCMKLFDIKKLDEDGLLSVVRNDENSRIPEVEEGHVSKELDRIREEKVFWRGQEDCQWDRVEGVEKILWIQEGLDLEFVVDKGRLDVEKRRFSTVSDLVEKADPTRLNVFYCKSAVELLNLFSHLVNEESYLKWSSLFCDEWEDVAPLNMSEPYRGMIADFKNNLKQARKRRVSFYGATQQPTEIDWKAKNKVMYWVYFMGAKPPQSSRVWQRAIDGLSRGEAYLTNKSLFEEMYFEEQGPVHYVNIVDGMPERWSMEALAAEER